MRRILKTYLAIFFLLHPSLGIPTFLGVLSIQKVIEVLIGILLVIKGVKLYTKRARNKLFLLGIFILYLVIQSLLLGSLFALKSTAGLILNWFVVFFIAISLTNYLTRKEFLHCLFLGYVMMSIGAYLTVLLKDNYIMHILPFANDIKGIKVDTRLRFGLMRAQSFISNSLPLAHYYLLLTGYFLTEGLYSKKVSLVILLNSILVVLLTQSRVAIALGLLTVVVFVIYKKPRLSFLFGSLLASLVFLFKREIQLVYNIFSVGYGFEKVKGMEYLSESRWDIYMDAVVRLFDQRSIIGFGAHTFFGYLGTGTSLDRLLSRNGEFYTDYPLPFIFYGAFGLIGTIISVIFLRDVFANVSKFGLFALVSTIIFLLANLSTTHYTIIPLFLTLFAFSLNEPQVSK